MVLVPATTVYNQSLALHAPTIISEETLVSASLPVVNATPVECSGLQLHDLVLDSVVVMNLLALLVGTSNR